MGRQNHLSPSKPFDTGWYLFFAYVIRFLDELSAGCIMIMSNLHHQIKNLLLINKPTLWHSVLIVGILFIWFITGWFFEFDLVGFTFDSIQVVAHILPTAPHIKSPEERRGRASFFNRKRYGYYLTMRTWRQHNHCGSGRHARSRYRFGLFHHRHGQYKKSFSKATSKSQPNFDGNLNYLDFMWWWNCISYYNYMRYANKLSCHL